MAQIIELYALVRKDTRDVGATITQIIRTYEGRSRADQDMELLNDVDPATVYEIVLVPHIEH